MSPQLMWGMAGLVLTIATLGGVGLSSYQSLDAANGKMVASEAGNIAIATKLWLVNNSGTGKFTDINAEGMAKYIPDLSLDASTPKKFKSKVSPDVSFAITKGSSGATAATTDDQAVISIAGIPTDQQDPVFQALLKSTCVLTETAKAAALTLTCKG